MSVFSQFPVIFWPQSQPNPVYEFVYIFIKFILSLIIAPLDIYTYSRHLYVTLPSSFLSSSLVRLLASLQVVTYQVHVHIIAIFHCFEIC